MIKKVSGGYKVLSEKGKRLKQVEYFKHKG